MGKSMHSSFEGLDVVNIIKAALRRVQQIGFERMKRGVGLFGWGGCHVA